MLKAFSFLALLAMLSCSSNAESSQAALAVASLDAIHMRIAALHRERDPVAYSALHSDSVVFDWPMLAPVRGRPAIEALMRENWKSREGLQLVLTLVARRIAGGGATEVMAYRESWTDSAGMAVTEHGRFVMMLTQSHDQRWYIDRFFGFSDSTQTSARTQ